MHHIFISYSSQDRAFAQRLASALQAEGWTVWWDRKIPVGKSFHDVLEDAIDAAQCVVVVWSEHAVNSDWVRNEAEEGKRRNVLVPVRLGDVRIPLGFRHLQAADLKDWQPGVPDAEYDMLLESIRTVFAEPAPQPEPEPPRPEPVKPVPVPPKEEARRTEPEPVVPLKREPKPDPPVPAPRGEKKPVKGWKKEWLAVAVAFVVIAGAVLSTLIETQDDYPPESNYGSVPPPNVGPSADTGNSELSVQWQDHAVGFTGILEYTGGVQGTMHATLRDLATGATLGEQNFAVQIGGNVASGQYVVSGQVTIPNGDSTTPGMHTHDVYLQLQRYPNGSWAAQNCTSAGCFNATVK